MNVKLPEILQQYHALRCEEQFYYQHLNCLTVKLNDLDLTGLHQHTDDNGDLECNNNNNQHQQSQFYLDDSVTTPTSKQEVMHEENVITTTTATTTTTSNLTLNRVALREAFTMLMINVPEADIKLFDIAIALIDKMLLSNYHQYSTQQLPFVQTLLIPVVCVSLVDKFEHCSITRTAPLVAALQSAVGLQIVTPDYFLSIESAILEESGATLQMPTISTFMHFFYHYGLLILSDDQYSPNVGLSDETSSTGITKECCAQLFDLLTFLLHLHLCYSDLHHITLPSRSAIALIVIAREIVGIYPAFPSLFTDITGYNEEDIVAIKIQTRLAFNLILAANIKPHFAIQHHAALHNYVESIIIQPSSNTK